MRRILAGVETEYGLLVEGHGAEEQIDDAMALVRGYPGERLALWDYRHESPRADLRGFQLERLAVDPIDEQFDAGKQYGSPQDVRSDLVLPNGARFYNDHGHPEYATPERFTLAGLAHEDLRGEEIVLRAARHLEAGIGRKVSVFKNNTDFHGASYGTHESYCIPRKFEFQTLYNAIMPMLVCRQILTGAGKVGSESGDWCDFQISQRADFFTEAANAETLYRRPVFNTRDEPHADPEQWIRLHVISGDANRMPGCTIRKVGLVKLAIALMEIEESPTWRIADPVRAFKSISRDPAFAFKLELEGRNWTTAYEILESYFCAAEARLELDAEMVDLISDCRHLMELIRSANGWNAFARQVDWAAKREMIGSFLASEGGTWRDAQARAFDLEYSNIDPDEGLYDALIQMEMIDGMDLQLEDAPTRGDVRGWATSKFGSSIQNLCWRSITFKLDNRIVEVELDPNRQYSEEMKATSSVEEFVQLLRGEQ